jgi:hypothetical protein
MPYVKRDESGLIVGIFENLQPGFAEEFVSGEVAIDPQPLNYKRALEVLNAVYQTDIARLNGAFSLVFLADGQTEAAKMAAIRAQYETRKTQHTARIAALKLEYGV